MVSLFAQVVAGMVLAGDIVVRDRLQPIAQSGADRLFDGFYKVDYGVGPVVGRSVMYCADGKMLGGNSAFAHVGTYREVDGEIVAEISGQRHNDAPGFATLYGSDTSIIHVRGLPDGSSWRFAGNSTDAPGAPFWSVMRRLDEESIPVDAVGADGIVNGLYSIHIRLLDGLDGGLTGVMLLNNGRILGGDAFFYYLGSYTSANGRWKGQMLNQEHTPAKGENAVFGGYETGIGFSGTCDRIGAHLEATALVGKRSMRLTAELKLLYRA